jgi:hypothetical protein
VRDAHGRQAGRAALGPDERHPQGRRTGADNLPQLAVRLAGREAGRIGRHEGGAPAHAGEEAVDAFGRQVRRRGRQVECEGHRRPPPRRRPRTPARAPVGVHRDHIVHGSTSHCFVVRARRSDMLLRYNDASGSILR